MSDIDSIVQANKDIQKNALTNAKALALAQKNFKAAADASVVAVDKLKAAKELALRQKAFKEQHIKIENDKEMIKENEKIIEFDKEKKLAETGTQAQKDEIVKKAEVIRTEIGTKILKFTTQLYTEINKAAKNDNSELKKIRVDIDTQYPTIIDTMISDSDVYPDLKTLLENMKKLAGGNTSSMFDSFINNLLTVF